MEVREYLSSSYESVFGYETARESGITSIITSRGISGNEESTPATLLRST